MTQSGRRESGREHFWRKVITAWGKSGLSVRAFCRGRGLNEPGFYSWRRRLQECSQPRATTPAQGQATFVPVRVVADALIDIVLPTGLVVRVPVRSDATAIAHLVAALRTAAC